MELTRNESLRSYFASSPEDLRPIMTSLNGDNSWLLSFPRPKEERTTAQKVYYHIVFEPWLEGPFTLLAGWFLKVALANAPIIADAAAIETAAKDIEDAASAYLPDKQTPLQSATQNDAYTGFLDAILLQFHYMDHTHPLTLQTFDRRIPVIATPEANKVVAPLKHFHTILLISDFDRDAKDWRKPELHPGGVFPNWLTPLRMPGHHELNFVFALIWTHGDLERHEVMLNSPHGTRLDQEPLQAFLNSEPKTEMLAMMHGLKENWSVNWQTTYGIKGGLELYRRVGGVKYWVLSHHSNLIYSGIIMWLTRTKDIFRTIEWGLEDEQKTGKAGDKGRPNFTDVENGNCFILV